MFESVVDYSTAGQNPLAFTRYYNSMSAPDTYAIAMGANWRHAFDRYLHIIDPSAIFGVTVERPDGQYISFSSSSGIYSTDSDVDYKLTKSGTTWTLTDPNDTVETYSQSGAEATLSTIKLRNGYTQTMHYTSGKLTSVTDSYSRTLGMTYTGNLLTGVTTPDTLALTYGYTAVAPSNVLSTVTYNTSPATHQTYLYENASYPFALTGITDENNHRYATWSYDGMGRAASSQLASGVNFTSVSYFSNGNRAVKGPLGIIETYKFSTLQGVPKVTEIDRVANGTVAAATRLFTYDSNGYLKSATDWNGNQTAYTNNSLGLPTSIVYASGSPVTHTTSITYDTTWAHLAKTITTPGLTTTNNYDATTGNLLTRVLADTTSQTVPYSTNGQTRTWTFTWTTTGQLLTAQLPRTDVVAKTTFAYGAASPNLGTLVSITDALSHVTTINTYKPGGLPLTVTDPNSVLTTLAYNPRNWLTSSVLTTAAGNLTSSLQYDSAGQLTKTTLPDASYLAYAYNNAHQLTTVTNPLSETQNITYNSAGNMTQGLWKNASAVTKRQHTGTYDALGRVLTDVGGMSQTTTFGYDSNSNVTSIKDPLLHMTYQTFDQLNRLKTYKDAALNLTTTTYDAHDRPLTVTDPKGNVTSYVYDGFGEAIQIASPDSGTTVFHYDPDGNVSSKTDAASAVTNYTYDALDRLLTKAYPADSTLNVSMTYDQTGHGKGIGRLTSLTDQAGSLSRNYEERGLVTSNACTIGTTAYTTGYTYESAGRLASITIPHNGYVVGYSHDAAGQVTNVSNTQPGHAAYNVVSSVTHMPFGPVSGFNYYMGLVDTRAYDLDYRTTEIVDQGASRPASQHQFYTYDADNNVHILTDYVDSSRTQTLTYDSVDRLASAVGNYGTVSSITYDSSSNRLTYGSTSYTVPSTSNRMSAAGTTSIGYTASGNINAIGSDTMTYNKANQLAATTVSGTTSTNVFDAFGQRLKTTVGTGTPVVYSYDESGNLLDETDGTNDTEYVWLDGAPVEALTVYPGMVNNWLMYDALGTPQLAMNYYFVYTWYGNYAPFGAAAAAGSLTFNLRFPGQHADATGYHRNGFRDYNPSLGRYLESDPVGLVGGLNTYNYAAQNPFSFVDPDGTNPFLAILAGAGAYVFLHPSPANAPGPKDAVYHPVPEIRHSLDAIGAGFASNTIGPASPSIAPPSPPLPGEGQCTAGGPQNAASAPALAHQLAAQEVFTAEGKLTADAIARSQEITSSEIVGNPNVPFGFSKYSTSAYRSPSGDFQVHYYMNSQTGEIDYGIDYKTIFLNGAFKR